MLPLALSSTQERVLMERFIALVRKVELGVLVTLGLAATLLMSANAIGRYLFSYTIVWAEELIRIFFVWGMFIAITHAFVTNEHIGFNNIADRNRLTKTVSVVITNLVLLITGVSLAVLGSQYSALTGAIRLAGSNLPTALLQIPGILAGGFWALLAIFRLGQIIIRRGLPDGPGSETRDLVVTD